MERIAVYPGSFDPFTLGHLDIVMKGAALFDKVFVMVGINSEKHRRYTKEWMRNRINDVLADKGMTNCTAVSYDGLTAEYARACGAKYIIRGLRNSMDYGYEESIAEVNKLIYPELEYVYFRADRTGVSSTMVRELIKRGKDVSDFIPKAIAESLKN